MSLHFAVSVTGYIRCLSAGASCGKFHKQNIHWKQLRQHNELSELLPRSQIAIDCSEVWVSTHPVFRSSWILCRADLHSFDQHTVGGKIIWARARRLSDNNNLT